MLISVVIPTCHRNDMLAECLDCIAPGSQTLGADRYEVIVTDDGSQSSARELILDRFPWVRWVEGPRKGPAANRNNGVGFAGGRWLAFTDDDCLPDRNWLMSLAAATPDSVVLEGKVVTDLPFRGLFYTAPVNYAGGLLWSCNLAIDREVFLRIGGFDINFPNPHLEDVDLRYRLSQEQIELTFVESATVFHSQRPIGPIIRQSLAQESSFYFSRKHKISKSALGLTPYSYFRRQVGKVLRESTSFWEGVSFFLCRSLVEGTLIAIMLPFWARKYRKR